MCVEKIEQFKRQQQQIGKKNIFRKHFHEMEQCFSRVYFYDFIIGTLESSLEKKKKKKY